MGKGCVRFKTLEDLALDTRARRVETERAKERGCLTRSVKLAQLVRYCSFSAEAVTIARSTAPPAHEIALLAKSFGVRSRARVRRGANGQLPGSEGAYGVGLQKAVTFAGTVNC